ncbi:MAG: esterase-like activity of phytase family protein [Thermomicrobiales bacterium]
MHLVSRRRVVAIMGAAAVAPQLAVAQSGTPTAATPVASPAASPVAGGAVLKATYTLPDIPLAKLQNEAVPDYPIANDRGFLLGGIGSDIFHVPGTEANLIYMVTDRGPNGDVTVGDEERTTFPVPDFTPTILLVALENEAISVIDAMPLVGKSGKPVTGLPNTAEMHDPAWDYTGTEQIPFNPSGLDTEGLVMAGDGSFWLSEEYMPSIVHARVDGTVITRFVPQGTALPGADYQVMDTLPAIFAHRRNNRGFEGLAISGDKKTLFAALQSPLYVPDKETGKASVNTRILAFGLSGTAPTAEYVYQFDDVTTFDPSAEGKTDAMKVSGIAWVNETTLLVIERTDPVAKIYAIDIAGATNILGGVYDDPATSPSLEAQNDLSGTDVVPVKKTLVVDLNTLAQMPEKIEGLAILDDTTIAVANDNDFDINEFDAKGNTIPTGRPSQVFVIGLPSPLGIAE